MQFADSMSVTLHISPSAGADMKFYIVRADHFTKAMVSNSSEDDQICSPYPDLAITHFT